MSLIQGKLCVVAGVATTQSNMNHFAITNLRIGCFIRGVATNRDLYLYRKYERGIKDTNVSSPCYQYRT